jgi:hypothetical protein
MTVIGSVFRVIFAIIVGLLIGLLIGVILGLVFGLGISLIFREIIAAHGTVVVSILLAVILGGLIGYIARQITNRMLGLRDNPFAGALLGAVVGFVFVGFLYGVIDISNPAGLEYYLNGVAILYCVILGGRIGALVFAILAAVAVIREGSMARARLRESMSRANEPSIYTLKTPSSKK